VTTDRFLPFQSERWKASLSSSHPSPSWTSRIIASPDIYSHGHREPEQSINFITCTVFGAVVRQGINLEAAIFRTASGVIPLTGCC
jgi:hypothetical protein